MKIKNLISIIALAISTVSASAQVPDAMRFQTVLRDANGLLIANKSVGIRLTIEAKSGSNTTDLYAETFTTTTSLDGIATVVFGKGDVVKEGKDVTIVATGICVDSALGAAELLKAEGIDAEVVNICTIKPLDEELIVKSAKKTGKVVTVEEHSVIGGLGSAVCDALCKSYPVPVCKIGMQDVFGESGPAAALIEKYGLDAKGVCKSVKEFIGK